MVAEALIKRSQVDVAGNKGDKNAITMLSV